MIMKDYLSYRTINDSFEAFTIAIRLRIDVLPAAGEFGTLIEIKGKRRLILGIDD
jgi:hypothetical protein